MDLFHVSASPIAPGQAIRPYVLKAELRDALDLVRRALDGDAGARSALLTARGYLRRRFRSDPDTQMVLMETVFERVRVELAPTLPGRFESAFCWPTRELAQWFHDRYRPTGVIHRCVLTEGDQVARDSSFVVGGVNLSARLDDALRPVEQRATRYWMTDEPLAYPEVLVRGRVIVVEALSATP